MRKVDPPNELTWLVYAPQKSWSGWFETEREAKDALAELELEDPDVYWYVAQLKWVSGATYP